MHREAETAATEKIRDIQKKMEEKRDELTKNQRKGYRKKLKKLKERLLTTEHDKP